jgi:hypothetical protein
MTATTQHQSWLFYSPLAQQAALLKDDLLDHVDRLLEDPDLVERVRQCLARHPPSTRTGRIRSLPCFPEIVLRLRGILERFLNAVGCMDACFVSDDTLENLSQPAQVGQIKVGGIDLNQPRMRGLPARSWHCPLAPRDLRLRMWRRRSEP